mgnify:CR=1 FL=1
MSEKFHAAIERLKNFADKIEDRLDKAEDNGKDVNESRAKLVEARTKIIATETALADAKAKYAEAVKNPDFKASFAKVKEVVSGVVEKVREAHKALVDVVTSMKGLGGGVEKSPVATTTPVAVPAQQ